MKYFTSYINESEIKCLNEGFLDKLINWFKGVYKNQTKLEKTGLKINDLKEIKSPEKPMKLSEIEKNEEELNLINDKKVGFPQTSIVIQNKSKYLSKDGPNGKPIEYEVLVDRFFYVDNDSKYDIGMILYDIKNQNDNKYVNLLNFEILPKVDNISQIEKYVNNAWETNMKKQNYKGSQYVVKLPKVKATLKKLMYKAAEDDHEDKVLYKKFK